MIQLDDFYALAPAHRCIYRPTKDAWLNDAIDMRLPRQALLDANGNPLRNDKGKIIMVTASQWLAIHRSVERATWLG